MCRFFIQKAKIGGHIQGVPKKVSVKPNLELQNLGGVFLGVKNNSKNFENKKIVGCLAKFLLNGHYLLEKLRKFCNFMTL